MFCEESLGKIKFRAFPKSVGPRILSLESVDYFETGEHYHDITEWSKNIRIMRLPNISGLNRNFFVLEAISQMFGRQYNTIQFNKMQSNAMQIAVQYNTKQYNKML